MADKEQQTEQATPKKTEKLRKDGKVPKSADVTAVVSMAVAGSCIMALGGHLTAPVSEFSQRAFRLQYTGDPLTAVGDMMSVVVRVCGPIVAATFLGAVLMGIVQTRGLFSLSLIQLKLDRLNPIPQLPRIFPTPKSLAEVGKQLLKLSVLGVIVFNIVSKAFPGFALLAANEPITAAAAVGESVTDVFVYGTMAFTVVAGIDFLHALRTHNEESKMSKQDVKDEHKQEQASPHLKQKARQKAREYAEARSTQGVKEATVLITNPTHISVALRYKPEQDATPIVLAKGTDHLALTLRIEARSHGIPIVENRPLARSLHKDVKVGQPIEAQHYKAAAQVIAHVMGLHTTRTPREMA